MEKKKRQKLEDKLRELIMQEDRDNLKKTISAPPPQGVRVIRRRKGSPDMQIA